MKLPSFAMMIGILLVLMLVNAHPKPAVAATYSCGSADKNHCYGIAEWDDPTEIFAVSTTLSPVNLYCKSCNGFIDDETWLVDRTSAQCQKSKFHMCWVEVGFEREEGRKNTDFFWADNRAGHGFAEHWLGAINGITDDLQLLLVKDTERSADSTTYLVFILSANFNQVSFYSGKSTKNSMTPTAQLIGQELEGSKGASADPEIFLHTQVSNTPDQFVQSGALVERSTNGGVVSDNPPLGAWLAQPTSLPGGAFVTACCDPPPPATLAAKVPARRFVSINELGARPRTFRKPTGLEALRISSKGTRGRVTQTEINRFFASKPAIGRVAYRSMHVENLEFLTAREAGSRMDSIELGVEAELPVVLASMTGNFEVSVPRGGKPAQSSKALAAFDAQSGNLLSIYVPEP
jgi:hypothetical protein